MIVPHRRNTVIEIDSRLYRFDSKVFDVFRESTPAATKKFDIKDLNTD